MKETVEKEDLEKTAGMIEKDLSELNLKAFVSINKAVVTQSSAAIPVVPLYISLLFSSYLKFLGSFLAPACNEDA